MSSAARILPSTEEQKCLFFSRENKYTVNQLPQEGVFVFAISKKWFDAWTRYVEFNDKYGNMIASHPGPVDNSDINYTHNKNVQHQCLRPDLEQGVTHEWITQKQWKLLHKWYGGGPEFGRQVLTDDDDGMPVDVDSIAWRDLMAIRVGTLSSNHGMNLNFEGNVQTYYFHQKATLRHVAANVCIIYCI